MSHENTTPAQAFFDRRAVGDVLDGNVVSVEPFGAFVELAEGVHGLLHESESTQQHAPGEPLRVEILAVDPARGRLSLRPA
jgi:ribosomal protein S1